MIIVTGSKRSGTSAWMQVLGAAGLPVLGKAFPARWEASIGAANPRGFFEGPLRKGVWWATNPDPTSGRYLHPTTTREHVVKIFVPGLIHTDHAFLHRVLCTMRDWRGYSRSLSRLYALEDLWLNSRIDLPAEEGGMSAERVARLRAARGSIPLPVEWWFETYDLFRDVATRRYAFHMLTYDRLLRDPEGEISQVLRWVGRGDLKAAIAAVEPSLRTQHRETDDLGMDPECAALFDELYATVDAGSALQATFVGRMNEIQQVMLKRWDPRHRRTEEADLEPAD